MKSQVLHTVWCNISGEDEGEIWNWSLFRVKGLILTLFLRSSPQKDFLPIHSAWRRTRWLHSRRRNSPGLERYQRTPGRRFCQGHSGIHQWHDPNGLPRTGGSQAWRHSKTRKIHCRNTAEHSDRWLRRHINGKFPASPAGDVRIFARRIKIFHFRRFLPPRRSNHAAINRPSHRENAGGKLREARRKAWLQRRSTNRWVAVYIQDPGGTWVRDYV